MLNTRWISVAVMAAACATSWCGPRNLKEPVGCGKGEILGKIFRRGDLPDFRQPALIAALRGFNDTDVLSNFLQFEAVTSNSTIIGTNLMTIKALAPINSFEFSLDDALPISSLKLNGVAITYTRLDPVRVQANFPSTISAGTTFTLEISYSGTPQGSGLGSFYFNTHGTTKIVETLSEPYYCYTWWPTKEDNTDKAVNAIWVTVPNTLSVAANGLYQGSVTLTGSRKQYKFQSVNPMSPYLLCFAATNYNKYTDSWTYGTTTMPLEFYLWPESDTTPANRNAWLNVKQMLTTESDLYGIYPFTNEKYGMYQFSFSGGMEHQTMTGMGGFWESVTAHELGHQWWGDMITCATWNDIWLNESFATYTEALWYEKKPGSTGLPALQSAMSSRRPTTSNGTVYCFDTTDVNRIFSSNFSYKKGAWVLHMLRHIMGDTKFFQTLAEWRSRYAYDAATTQDFVDTASFVYGSDLSWFFDKWLYQVGAPNFQYASSPVTINGQSYVQVLLKQVQTSPYPIFTMPIDVRLTSGSNVSTQVVTTNLATQYYLLPAPGANPTVDVDPDTWVYWTGRTAITYVAGPPKIAISNLVPNKTYTRAPKTFTLTFQSNINFNSSNVSMTRNGLTTPITASYNSSTKTITVTPVGKMIDGLYNLTVSDNITAVDSGQKLDGEVFTALPTGNGVAGGSANITFTVDASGPREP